jgi:hypothetical protein
MKPLMFLVCLAQGHEWRKSRRREGYRTCLRCELREPRRNPTLRRKPRDQTSDPS